LNHLGPRLGISLRKINGLIGKGEISLAGTFCYQIISITSNLPMKCMENQTCLPKALYDYEFYKYGLNTILCEPKY
ncbi:MAG: hypothetical protein LBF58_02865, partial [Deltaproteobacteria bacterium]|nr:hypothetical protein [Deltaproteobacteria bacterium]